LLHEKVRRPYIHGEQRIEAPTQGADNPAMVMSLVASMRGLTLIPAYVESLMPWSVVSRPLAGEVPTIDLAVGYKETNTSPVLKLFLSHLDDLVARVSTKAQLIATNSDAMGTT
jgi:LysR family transcriptional regulator, hca operon transcriptional activator